MNHLDGVATHSVVPIPRKTFQVPSGSFLNPPSTVPRICFGSPPHAVADSPGRRRRHRLQRAVLHGAVGELDAAFEHLDQAFHLRDPALVYLAVAPQWDCLRDDPRFADRLKRMALRSV